MLAWVLNTHLLLLEDSSNVLFLYSIVHYKLKFTAFNSFKHVIIKPLYLLITIPLIRTKTPFNNLLMNKIYNERATKLRIFEIVILNTK